MPSTKRWGEKARKAKTWPSSARALSGRVRRAATFLRKVGVDITFEREGRARTRTIRITRNAENVGATSSKPSTMSADKSKSPVSNGFQDDSPRTDFPPTDANTVQAPPETVRTNLPQNNNMSSADGADANMPVHSASWRTRL